MQEPEERPEGFSSGNQTSSSEDEDSVRRIKKSPKPRGRPPMRLSESHDAAPRLSPGEPESDMLGYSAAAAAALKKRRGRPPGSKNRPKNGMFPARTPDIKKNKNATAPIR